MFLHFRLLFRAINRSNSRKSCQHFVPSALYVFVSACLVIGTAAQDHPKPSETPASPPLPTETTHNDVGNEACAKCHSSIYESYKRTPMAHASGPAMENLIPADFRHQQSGVHYHIYADAGRAWLTFDRDHGNAVYGKRELLYYIGSGRRGLTYLFADDGFVFESPINWYGDRHVWDMTPAYQNAVEVRLNLPAHTSCLHCHVSGIQPPLKGTKNRYKMPLLVHSGVSCERCHGSGSAHLKRGPIVNPAKLSPERRDAICMQCHMEGRVSVERPGRHIYEFRPGDSLSDYIRYYVLADYSSRLGAVSQVEALAQSGCKRGAGDALSCTSCHDPHSSPSAQERVAYFREKCLACHGVKFAAKHHVKQKDCTACHMPALPSKDVAHTEVTDHRIPRVRNFSQQLSQDTDASRERLRLVPFPDSREAEDDLRDLALAWESLANTGVEAARPQAEQMLRRSATQFPNDARTLSALGYEDQVRGDIVGARTSYQRALASHPNLIGAATNLGVIAAQSGNFPLATKLLQGAFDSAPGRSSIGIDLARVFCLEGRLDEGRASLARVLEFNPDMTAAKRLLEDLRRPNPSCNAN
jgi:predicted CXXCH cytochrome family protein